MSGKKEKAARRAAGQDKDWRKREEAEREYHAECLRRMFGHEPRRRTDASLVLGLAAIAAGES